MQQGNKARDAKARDPRVDDPRAERRAKADGAAWFERVGRCDFLVDNAFSFVKQQACVASQYRQLYENATSAPHARSARGALSGSTPSHRHVSTTAKWLLVTHVACFDHISVGEVFRTVTSYASPNFHVVLNLFRGAQLGAGFGLVFGVYESAQHWSAGLREPRIMIGHTVSRAIGSAASFGTVGQGVWWWW